MPMSAPAHATLRGFEELRGVLVELVEEGSALGLTAAELFLQFGDRACSDGIGSRELQKGLASLSIDLTEAEIDTLLTGAGCTDENGPNPEGRQLLTLELFSAMVEKPTAVPPPALASDAAALPPTLDIQQPPSSAKPGGGAPLNGDDENNNRRAAEGDGGCVTPDSLAPRMSLSELLVDVREAGRGGNSGGDGPGTSSSAAAHVEAFGRVAANVQAVLATAISRSETGHGPAGSGGGGSGGGEFGGHDRHTSIMSDNRNQRSSTDASNARTSQAPVSNHSPGSVTRVSASRRRVGGAERTGDEDEDGEEKHPTVQEDTAAQTPPSTRVSTTASRSGPVPRTGAITPPLGAARSPSEPLHPTRASREKLEAALEGLDLKERLRPTTPVEGNGQGGGGGGGGDNDDGSVRSARGPHRSAGARLPSSTGLSRRLASGDVGGGNVVNGGGHSRRVSATGARMVAGVDERHARIRRPSERASGRVGAGSERRRCLGEVVHLAAAERGDSAAYDGGSEEAPEVIGRLRARVAELELSQQLLRCELEGARADLVSKGRRAEEEARREVGRAKERERTLQAKMGARVRAAEAEAAAVEKRMGEFKRASAAEAAAREKSSADYLRRRLKEVEATLEAKTARRSSLLSKQHQHQHQHPHHQASPTSRRRQGRRRESWGDENGADSPGDNSAGGGGVDGGRGAGDRWARPRARRTTGALDEPGSVDADGRGDKSAAVVMVMATLREELASCRKKLEGVTDEASRLRKEAKRSEKDDARREAQRQAEKQGAGDAVGRGGRRAARAGKACAVCGERGRSSRERQRERERRLEARVAESEDARIKVEAEAGRLQAFLDEMRGLRPLFVGPRPGGGIELAAE